MMIIFQFAKIRQKIGTGKEMLQIKHLDVSYKTAIACGYEKSPYICSRKPMIGALAHPWLER